MNFMKWYKRSCHYAKEFNPLFVGPVFLTSQAGWFIENETNEKLDRLEKELGLR